VDCDDYCHRVCYKESINPAENDSDIMISITKNKKQNINLSVDSEHRITTTKNCSKETIVDGFLQPMAVMYSTFIRKRCTINRIIEALHKLFPEVMHPPYNGFFFGNSNNTKLGK